MDKDLSLKINHSVFYNKNQTDNVMAKYRKQDYLETIKEYSSRTGFRRYDGTMDEFINNQKINADHNLNSEFYSISITGDITNYFMKKEYVSAYKNHLFHILDLQKEASNMFESVVMLYIDGYCIRDAYLLCRHTNTYLFLNPKDFDPGVLNDLIENKKRFTILFLPHSRYFETSKSPAIKYNQELGPYAINKNAYRQYLNGKDVTDVNDGSLTGISSWFDVYDYGSSKRKNMLVSESGHYEHHNVNIYVSRAEFLNTMRTSVVDSERSFMIDTVYDIARYSQFCDQDIYKDHKDDDFGYETDQKPIIDPITGYMTISLNNEYLNVIHSPYQNDSYTKNRYVLLFTHIIDCTFDVDTAILINDGCTQFSRSLDISSTNVRTPQIRGIDLIDDFGAGYAFSIKSTKKVTGTITLDLKLWQGGRTDGIYRYPICEVTNNSATFSIDRFLNQVDTKDILIFKLDKFNTTRERIFLHDVKIKRTFPNCYTIYNLPDDVQYITYMIIGNEINYPNYFNSIERYISVIGEKNFREQVAEGNLLPLLKDYQPKELHYSIDDYIKNSDYDKNDDGYEKYQYDKLTEYLPNNEVLYKKYIESCYRNQMHNVAKTMYIDLSSDEWGYIRDRTTRSTYMYDSSGNIIDSDLMKKTNISFSEDMIYIKLSDSDNQANTFCVWIDGFRYYNSKIYMEDFSTWIFIPRRLIKNYPTIEIEMFFFDNQAKNLLVFDTINTQITMRNPDNLAFQDPYPSLKDIGNGIKDIIEGDKIFRYVKTSNLKKGNWIKINEGCNSNTLLFYNATALNNFNALLDSGTIVSESFTTTKDILTFNDENAVTGIYGDKFGNWNSVNPGINAIVSKYNFGSSNSGLFIRVSINDLSEASAIGLLEFITSNNITVSYGTDSPVTDTLYYEKCQFNKVIPANLVFIDIDNEELIDNSNFAIKFDDSDEPILVNKLYKYETNLENSKLCLVSSATDLVNKHILVVYDDTYSMIYKGDANPSGKVKFNVEDYTGYYEESGKYRSRLYMANRFCYPDMKIVQSAERDVYHKDWFISAIINSNTNSIEASFEFLPYYYKLIYSTDRIQENGLIDLRFIINKPFSLEYYDVYLNGRKLNYSNIIVICDDMIKLKNVNSLRHFRIYEKLPLGDNFGLYPTNDDNTDAIPSLNSDLMHTDNIYTMIYPDTKIPDSDDNIFDDVDISLIDNIDIVENIIFKLPIFPDINQLQGDYLTITESYLEPGTNVYRVNPDSFFNEEGTALINKVYHYNPDIEME